MQHSKRAKDQTPTKKDKLAKIKQTLFTGRLDELELFRSMLPIDQRTRADVLLIYGIGGIGKSSLFDEFQRICQTEHIPAARVDGQAQRSVPGILTSLYEQLKDRAKLSHFGEGLRHYKEIQAKLISRSDIPQNIIALLSKGVTIGASFAPGLGPVVTTLGEDTIKATINMIYSALSRKEDADFFLQPEDELTERFLADVNGYTTDKRLVVMFDTYEAMETLDDWVCDNFFANLGENVLMVIAGRHELHGDAWRQFYPLMIRRELKGFNDVEAREYLRKQGVTDERLIDKMITFARGHPLALSLLSDLILRLKVTDFPRVPEWRHVIKMLAERIIGDSVDPSLRMAIEACSVLRYFTEDSLAYLLQADDVSAVFEQVREFSFVRIRNGGLTIHDVVRDLMIEDLRWRAPERYLMVNRLAAQFYEDFMNRVAVGPHRDAALSEMLYHTIEVDELTGIDLFRREFKRAWRLHQFDTCQILVTDVSRHKLRFDLSRQWLTTYRGHLLFYRSKWQELDDLFTDLLAEPALDDNIRALSTTLLGTSQYRCGDLTSAWLLLEEARGLKEALGEMESLSEVYLTLGKIQRLRGNWDQVLALWTASLDIARKANSIADAAWASFNLAFLWSLRGDTDRAERLYLESLEKIVALKDKYGEARALSGLGEVALLKGDTVTALQYHHKAVMILEKMPDELTHGVVCRRMGDVYSNMGNEIAAEECYRTAILKSEQLQAQPYMGVAYLKYGDHLLRMGRLEEAKEYYLRSEQLMGKDASSEYRDAYHMGQLRHSQANFWHKMGQTEKAKSLLVESVAMMTQLGCTHYVEVYTKELESLSRTEIPTDDLQVEGGSND